MTPKEFVADYGIDMLICVCEDKRALHTPEGCRACRTCGMFRAKPVQVALTVEGEK